MRIKIKSLQEGGAFPFADYVPFAGMLQTQELNTKGSNNESSDELGLKDLMKMVGEMNGLPSDMNSLITSLTNLYRNQDFSSSVAARSVGVTTYLSALQKVKNAKFNLDLYNNAYSEVVKNGGLTEAAIDEHGLVYCVNVEDGTQMTKLYVNEYLNLDKYRAVTNLDLLRMRAEDPNMAFNNGFLGIVLNGIGQSAVTKYIHDAMSKLGSDLITKEGYSVKQQEEIIKGIELIESSGEPLLVKIKNSSKDLQRQLSMAVEYLWNTLPTNARTWLQLRGNNADDPNKGGKDLMTQLMVAETSSTYTSEIDIQENLNPDGTKKSSGSGGDSDVKTSLVTNVLDGVGADIAPFTINKGTQASMTVDGRFYRSIVDTQGKTIGTTNLEDMLSESGLMGIMDVNSISFGDQVVSRDQLSNIIYRNAGGTRVELPCTMDNAGHIIPRFDLLDEYNSIVKEAERELGDNVTKEQRDALIAKKCRNNQQLLSLLDGNGNLDHSMFQVFFVVDGYASDKNIKLDPDKNKLMEDVSDNDDVVKLFKTTLSTKNESYDVDRDNWLNPFDWGGMYDHLYGASVYIPIVSNNTLAGLTAHGDLVKYNNGMLEESFYQRWRKLKNVNSGSSSLLW